jgi:hypothetical protein
MELEAQERGDADKKEERNQVRGGRGRLGRLHGRAIT